jgi:hypothetical protein
MQTSLMSRFAESGFEPVEVEGRLVHPMLRLTPGPGDRLDIGWVSANSPRIQGLGIRLRVPGVSGKKGYGGALKVGDVESPAIMLWMDTAPPNVAIECVKVDEGGQLQISNRWRLEDGREDEWLNNYGMIVEQVEPDTFVLHCSDGYGDAPTFDDLVVRVHLVRA